MQAAWARFAKNPRAGPGWNALGTGDGGVLERGGEVGGGTEQWNLGVLGDVGGAGAGGSGVSVVAQGGVDYRCGLFRGLYEDVVGEEGMPF